MRRSRLIVASFVCVLSITPVAGATKPVAPADSWLAYGHDAQLTNFVPSRLLTPRTAPYLADKWTTQLDGAVVASPLYASGVSVDGRERDVLLFETEAGSIYALDPLDGTIIWRDSFGVITTPDGACGSYGFSSTPAIDEQRGVVYAISADGYIRGNPAVLLELALGGRDAADRGRAPPRVKVGRARLSGLRAPQRWLRCRFPSLTSTHGTQYFDAVAALAQRMNGDEVDAMVKGLVALRERGGRLFVLGVGGGAGHASHAVNDFRKLCAIESYAPTDNVSELTARTNDDGWETTFSAWLKVSQLSARDALFVFSVGGGSREHNVSVNLIGALDLAQEVGASIYGVVGSPGGELAQRADVAILIEPPPDLRTPLVESFQAVVWHALVSHPELAVRPGHWESIASE